MKLLGHTAARLWYEDACPKEKEKEGKEGGVGEEKLVRVGVQAWASHSAPDHEVV